MVFRFSPQCLKGAHVHSSIVRTYHAPLVACETLFENLDDDWVLLDCRHDLADPEAGPRLYAQGHIPGAVHAHVDHHLSAPVGDGSRGRHPLPEMDTFLEWLRTCGVDEDSQVVCYDDVGGAWAGRAWWLLRFVGLQNVAVLDGGLTRWNELELPLETKRPRPRQGSFDGTPGHMPTVDATRVQTNLGKKREALQIIDARAPERYHGEEEPLDPVAGHIPGALNLPYAKNLGSDRRFLSPDELRARYEDALGVQEVGRVAVYCGSGVTAAHDILAMELAGMGTAALYPGSWSEWCHPDSERPVTTDRAMAPAQ